MTSKKKTKLLKEGQLVQLKSLSQVEDKDLYIMQDMRKGFGNIVTIFTILDNHTFRIEENIYNWHIDGICDSYFTVLPEHLFVIE